MHGGRDYTTLESAADLIKKRAQHVLRIVG
jgi:hypothetical protein